VPRINWIVDCLQKRALIKYTDEGARIVNCDGANLATIRAVAELVRNAPKALRRAQYATLALPSPSAPTPLLAGLAAAYQILEEKLRGVVVLVTQDERLPVIARDLAIRYHAQESRIDDIFAIGHIRNNSLSREAFVRQGVSLDRFRLVIAARFDAEDIRTLENHGVPVVMVLFDGRTRKPDRSLTMAEREPAPASTYVLLAPSTKLRVASFPELGTIPDDRKPLHGGVGTIPLLVTPPKIKMKLQAHRVELDTRSLLADIMALKGVTDMLVKRFFDEALATYNALLAAPVHPSELDPVYRGQDRERVHPIHDSMEILAHYERVANVRHLVGSSLMPHVTQGLADLAAALDARSPKRDFLLDIIRKAGSARVVVADRSSARALREVLAQEGIAADVTAWTDPVTWAPEARPLILVAPMPHGREWVPTIELGGDVRFLLTPEEAARTERALERQGIQGGPGLQPLRRIMTPPPGQTLPSAGRPEESLGNLLDAAVLLAAAGDKELRRSIAYAAGDGMLDPSADTPMVELDLHDGRVFRIFPTSKLTVIKDGGTRRISIDEARSIINEDGAVVAVLSNSSLDEDLQSAAFRVWESMPRNRGIRDLAESWKEPIQKLIAKEGWSAKRICLELLRKGVKIEPAQARDIFLNDRTWAVLYQEESLVKAALEAAGEASSQERVDAHVAAITRLRGVHRAAGRWANDLGKATYLEVDDDLVKQAKDIHNIDISALRRHFFPIRVRGIRGPLTLPAAFLGLHPGNQDVFQ